MQVTPTQARDGEKPHTGMNTQSQADPGTETEAQTHSTGASLGPKGWCEGRVVGGAESIRAGSCGKQSSGKVRRQRRDTVAS